MEDLPVLVIYYTVEGGVRCVVSNHPLFSHVTGFHTDDDLSFYTNDMHMKALDEVGNRVLIYGNNLNSAENKMNTMLELFGHERPTVGQRFRATICFRSIF